MADNRNRNNFVDVIMNAISAAANITASSVNFGMSSKRAALPQIDEIMYLYVYSNGVSYDSVKNAHIKIYRKNKKYFDQQYQYWASRREQDIKNGTHTQQKKINQNNTLKIIFIIVIIILVFLIFRNFKK